jgi:hypothetical protein
MDILILNETIESEIKTFCSDALYNHVLDIFGQKGWVIYDERFELTSSNLFGVTVHSIWRIDDFVNNNDISFPNKLNLLMVYLECNGCILWGKENYSGKYFTPFLQRLVEESYIDCNLNTETFALWNEYRQGRTSKPQLDFIE